MCKRKMPGRITVDGKRTVGGGTREGVRLAKYGAVRYVIEEELEGDGQDNMEDNTDSIKN